LDSLLDQDCVADVNRLYGLCARVGALDALCASFKAHVRRIGGDMVADSKKDADMIPSLLRLKVRMDAMVEGGFKGNKEFGKAVREAFEGFINQRSGRPAELLAKHLDAVLRGALKGSGTAVPIGGDDEQDAAVDAALTLFRFLQVSSIWLHDIEMFQALQTE
jgi:cullin 4